MRILIAYCHYCAAWCTCYCHVANENGRGLVQIFPYDNPRKFCSRALRNTESKKRDTKSRGVCTMSTDSGGGEVSEQLSDVAG